MGARTSVRPAVCTVSLPLLMQQSTQVLIRRRSDHTPNIHTKFSFQGKDLIPSQTSNPLAGVGWKLPSMAGPRFSYPRLTEDLDQLQYLIWSLQ
jgi:hypothetical protein